MTTLTAIETPEAFEVAQASVTWTAKAPTSAFEVVPNRDVFEVLSGRGQFVAGARESIHVTGGSALEFMEVPRVEQFVVPASVVEMMEVGVQGPPGPPGPDGGLASFTLLAGQAISGHRLVVSVGGQVFLADPYDLAHLGKVIGISQHAAALGDPLSVLNAGLIENVGWGFDSGQVWLGALGQVVQAPPLTGIDQVVGVSVSPTQLFIDIEEPVLTYG